MKKTKLRIHTWPEKILRKKCKQVEKVDDEIRDLLSEMVLIMRISEGVGLAANQAGINLKLLVVEIDNKLFKLVNPRITKKEGTLCFLEGCLSFPGLELKVKRNDKVWISAQDENGKAVNFQVKGPLAVIFQHEVDHLEGVVFIDRVSFWQKLKLAPKLRAIVRKTKDGMRK